MAQLVGVGALIPSKGAHVRRSLPSRAMTGMPTLAALIESFSRAGAASTESLEVMRQWDESGASVTRASGVQLDLIERLYSLTNRGRVLRFLDEHAFLVPVLFEAFARILERFPLSRLFLEVVVDPEIAQADDAKVDGEQLILAIATSLEVEEAMNRLERLDNDWWLEVLPHTQGRLCVNLEFR